MWWVVKENSHSFEEDYGPWQGVDYARYSDPPNYSADNRLKRFLELEVKERFPETILDLQVRNGFVHLKTDFEDQELAALKDFLLSQHGVREVIVGHHH